MSKKPGQTVVFRTETAPKAPDGLGQSGVTLWKAIHSEYQINDEPSLEVLTCFVLTRARCRKARFDL